MFTLEWQASIKATILQDKDLQVAQINQFYITGEEIIKISYISLKPIVQKKDLVELNTFILEWTKVRLKCSLNIEGILLLSFVYIIRISYALKHFVPFNTKRVNFDKGKYWLLDFSFV